MTAIAANARIAMATTATPTYSMVSSEDGATYSLSDNMNVEKCSTSKYTMPVEVHISTRYR